MMWEEADEWWGKKLTLSVGFFIAVINSLRNTWYIVEGGEVLARGIGKSVEECKDAVELRMAALCND